jgi:hypothetical protein
MYVGYGIAKYKCLKTIENLKYSNSCGFDLVLLPKRDDVCWVYRGDKE